MLVANDLLYAEGSCAKIKVANDAAVIINSESENHLRKANALEAPRAIPAPPNKIKIKAIGFCIATSAITDLTFS
jgi:hypothetical protein